MYLICQTLPFYRGDFFIAGMFYKIPESKGDHLHGIPESFCFPDWYNPRYPLQKGAGGRHGVQGALVG